MSLHGTLETFALPDVMALLAATKKSGELRVVGERLDGRVHLDAGRVVAVNVGRADSFVDAVFELLRLATGKFSFDADQTADDPSEPVDIEPLLLEATARLSEWREIEAVVPSLAHGVGLVGTLADPHVTLGAEEWRMVVAVAASRCVSDVAEHLGLGEYAVCKKLKGLVESGVVEVSAEPVAAEKPAPAPAAKKAEPAPAPAPQPEAKKPEPAPEPEPEAKRPEVDGAKVVVEPERKVEDVVGKVDIPALTAKDNGPAPAADKKPEKKPEPAAKADAVSASQAKALVSQLAALSSEKPAKPEPKAEAKGDEDKAGAKPQAKKDDAKPEEAAAASAAEAAPGPEGGDSEEPLNRGLLLKFLSSVRQ